MIKYLIKNDKIDIYFQPIISIKDKKIFAYEALTRAKDENDELISPIYLFEQARKENLSTELDCYVRQLALNKFKGYYEKDNSILLFLNFESSIIDNEISDNFINIVNSYKIPPSNIVIEIKEDSVKENHSLVKFVSKYKAEKFLIAIDDFGTGYSSFDRLALIKPDIVKIDRSIIYDVDKNFINSEILSSISKMCHTIGALVLAEGVESENEILHSMKKDIDIFQGYYFSKAVNNIDESKKFEIIETINYIGEKYTYTVQELISLKQHLLKDAEILSEQLFKILEEHSDNYSDKLYDLILSNVQLEAVYILDHIKGIQVGDTITKSCARKLYAPTKDGHDHSLKEYYFIAKTSTRGDYLSTKYISKASGNMCRTYSKKVSIGDKNYIICLDLII